MPHDTPLISTIVAGLVLAFILGAIATRLRMPPLVGYLFAGVLVGPHTPGFVADAHLATELSEIGVILLMFGVGLHFSLKDLMSVRALAIPGAVVQIGGATLMGLGLASLMGWPLGGGLIFGLALSVASTVVLLKALQDRHMVESEKGRIAVGWLIVEDIAMVVALVLIPVLAGVLGGETRELHDPFVAIVERALGIQLGVFGVIAITVVKLAAFVGFMLVVGRRVIPFVLHYTAHTGSRELFRLAVLAIALGVAAGSAYLFGVSLALGAFFAGMILSESELSHRAAQETLPLRDAFAVLFFVAVGMLFDPAILVEHPLPVLATVFIIVIGKSVLAFLIVIAFRRAVTTALTISASLAQIGEFSFILAALGVSLNLLPEAGRDLILVGAMISIVLNPVVFHLLDLSRPYIEQRFGARLPSGDAPRLEPDLVVSATPRPAAAPEPAAEEEEVTRQPTTQSGHIVLVGYGRVGSVVADALRAAGRAFVVIEDAESRALAARTAGIEVVADNAAGTRALSLANVAEATTVIIAIPNAFEAGQAVERCRRLNDKLFIVARAHSDEEESHLLGLGANVVIMGEREIGMGMAELVTRDTKGLAEIAASDAVEQALAPLVRSEARRTARPGPMPGPATGTDFGIEPDAFAAALGAAPPVREAPAAGPAEPPAPAPAPGEEPDPAPASAAPPAPSGPRPALPATAAGRPFNPEVPPPLEEKV